MLVALTTAVTDTIFTVSVELSRLHLKHVPFGLVIHASIMIGPTVLTTTIVLLLTEATA